MKKFIATTTLLFSLSLTYGQKNNIQAMLDSLQFIKVDTLNCDAELYWRIIAQGKEAIPYLIDKLTDTTPTNIKYYCKNTKLNVGEIAHFALVNIADFPTFLVTHIRFDVVTIKPITGKSCWSFYDFLFNNSNKLNYQTSVREWYGKEKFKYIAKKIPKARRTECGKKYGIDKYYRWAG